jgi:hypothetical protein
MKVLLVLSHKFLVRRRWVAIRRFAGEFVRRVRLTHPAVHALDETRQHSPNFAQAGIESDIMLFRNQTEITREQKEILQLACRPRGNIKKLPKLQPSGASASVRNVRRHGGRSSPHLTRKAVAFAIRKCARGGVDAQHQRMTLLPHLQLLKVLHGVVLQGLSYIYLLIIINNCQLPAGMSC